MKKIFMIIKKILYTIFVMIMVVLFGILGLSAFVQLSVKKRILTSEEAPRLSDVDCLLVLGASVKDGTRPSLMLADRLDTSIELYNIGVSDVLLMSGDHADQYYNEVAVMKKYAVDKGVPSSDIFLDHKGFSTFDSMIRLKKVFGAKKVVIVTQEYHLYRALYIANKLGIEAYGVPAPGENYNGQFRRDVREVLARDKDFLKLLFEKDPPAENKTVDLKGDGDTTNEE